MGTGTGTPFRDKAPVVSKGCVESGEFNKRATSRQRGGGGGGLSRKGVLSSLLNQSFYKIVLIVFFIFFLAFTLLVLRVYLV